jgi:hypothetical protein
MYGGEKGVYRVLVGKREGRSGRIIFKLIFTV